MVFDPFSVLEEDDVSPENDPDEEFEDVVGEIPRETLFAFVAALFLVHVGLFAASLGVLLVYFRGQWLLGGAGIVGGGLALVAAVAAYRWHESVREESAEEGGENRTIH